MLSVLYEIKNDDASLCDFAACTTECLTSQEIIACYDKNQAIKGFSSIERRLFCSLIQLQEHVLSIVGNGPDWTPTFSREDIKSIIGKLGNCLTVNGVSNFRQLSDTVGVCHECLHNEAACGKKACEISLYIKNKILKLFVSFQREIQDSIMITKSMINHSTDVYFI